MTARHADPQYAVQLTRIARALAVAQNDVVAPDVAPGLSPDLVAMFTEGNLDKRFDKLRDQTELLEEGFPDLDELLSEYVRTVPLAAYDSGSSDGDRFARWVEQRQPCSAEQMDLLTVVRSRFAVEEIAREHRLLHVRFQERLSLIPELLPELGTNPAIRVYLNPVRVLSRFRSRLFLGEDSTDAADAVFFAVGTEIRVAVLETDAGLVESVLSHRDGLTVSTLQHHCGAAGAEPMSPERLSQVVSDSAELGLIALA